MGFSKAFPAAQPLKWHEACKKVSLQSLKKGKNTNYICNQFCWQDSDELSTELSVEIFFSFLETKYSWRIPWEKRSWHFWEAKKKNTIQWFFLMNIECAVPGPIFLSAISIPLLFLQVNFTCEFCHYLGGIGIALFYPSLNRCWAESTWVLTTALCVVHRTMRWIMCIASNACLQLGCLSLANDWPKGWAGFWAWMRKRACDPDSSHSEMLPTCSSSSSEPRLVHPSRTSHTWCFRVSSVKLGCTHLCWNLLAQEMPSVQTGSSCLSLGFNPFLYCTSYCLVGLCNSQKAKKVLSWRCLWDLRPMHRFRAARLTSSAIT